MIELQNIAPPMTVSTAYPNQVPNWLRLLDLVVE
jgi:hypothetical protein